MTPDQTKRLKRPKRRKKANSNTQFERNLLKHLGLPEDYVPQSEEEAMRLVIAALED